VTSDEPVGGSERGGGAEAGGARPEPTAAPAPPTEDVGAESARVPAQPERAFGEIDRARRRRATKAIAGLTVLVVLVLFVVWNAQPVEVNFVFGKAHPRMIWVMVACAVLGGVLGYLLGRPGHEGRGKEK
jgi:uncharacterized integral membrane protein